MDDVDRSAVADRAAGCLMGMACGDALGAPYEFAPPLGPDAPVGMVGGGSFGWAPGEWTDDTSMVVVLLEAAEHAKVDGVPLTERLDDVANGWAVWAANAPDVGAQTGQVLRDGATGGSVTARSISAAATALHLRTGRTAGNGSLMRTAPVALAYLDDEPAMADAARTVSELTHVDIDAGDACVLWCAAIRHAVLHGELDLRRGLTLLPEQRRWIWAERLDVAEGSSPADFRHNGWVVEALQAAWAAITSTAEATPGGEHGHLRRTLEAAARGGYDTDTVAAIAGALVGARYGRGAIPDEWLAVVHGWPGTTVIELGARGALLAL
ncbi:ADP-ribosylglycohydrolase family protein [Actinotalea sp. M2MS4P-6]|uniref:ADP-ribosylglycohydrolase family protein n=1 Tax=Actinotalea sp. M2MS4P-6 TaxID=2983762 RepID=UPI0021E3EEF6|nr:ADP-ribosylglycohydrolase family protein [Actinotalea sp. M2MS4P-6]MCV2392700.1 ADP-ribosylglycohydrolase family protein [Actinotalea sp. M2MS4P-6]